MATNEKKQSIGAERTLSLWFLFFIALVVIQLFRLQIISHDYYSTMALSSHEIYKQIHPVRGQIFFSDARNGETYPAAINRAYYKIYAVPSQIEKKESQTIADKLEEILALPPEKISDWREKMDKPDDPYEPLAQKVSEEKMSEIERAGLVGIYGAPVIYRFYPEEKSGAAVLGFCNFNEEENLKGNYGLEGYWNDVLAGKPGFLMGEASARGGWISLAGVTNVEAQDGADLVLTIDRAIEYKACARLAEAAEVFKAKSASLVMLEPASGAILAMCSYPEFDPNNYSQVDDVSFFNNSVIFTPYEPGSVMKPFTMAAAVDLNLVNANTTFDDPCERVFGKYTIHNALNKCYGDNVSMTQVLENSINTGMIWVSEKVKNIRLKDYFQKFGFGQKSGITLDTEVSGNISSLEKSSPIFVAQASFGQGITATSLQIALGYAAFANNGIVPKPFLVKEIHYSDGKKEIFTPQVFAQAISPRTAKIMTGMLTSVVEKTYAASVRMSGYYVAGKTGTAQIPGPGGYTDATNHTFAGFVPTKEPRFVMVVRFEAPERQWAESTAAMVFKDVADFTLDYLAVEEDK